jgi:hypothetical protein
MQFLHQGIALLLQLLLDTGPGQPDDFLKAAKQELS